MRRSMLLAACLAGATALLAGTAQSAFAGGVPAGWGNNGSGQLGDGTTVEKQYPVDVSALTEVKALAVAGDHTLALLTNGTVKAWGSNNCGQVGDGTTTNRTTPVSVTGLGEEVIAVAAADQYSLALLAGGKVLAWGCNGVGQLGNGTTTTSHEPTEVSGITEAAGIAAGTSHAIAVLKNGEVLDWGQNLEGDLGNGSYTTASHTPTTVSGVGKAVSVAAGDEFSMALLESGKIMTWGDDQWGELGNGTASDPGGCVKDGSGEEYGCSDTPVEVSGITSATVISAGASFALARLSGGSVKSWGLNDYGQLGNGNMLDGNCHLEFSVNEAGKTEWFPWPLPCEESPTAVSEVSGASAVAAGERSGLVLLTSGKVESWGAATMSGNGSTSPSDLPSSVPALGEVEGVAAGGNDGFSFGPALPTASGVSPSKGPGTGGTEVTISGTNLSGATAVKFGNVSATVLSVEATAIKALAPTHKIGSVDVTVVTSRGVSVPNGLDKFTYAPEVLGFGRCKTVGAGEGAYKNAACTELGGTGKHEWITTFAKPGITFSDGTEGTEKTPKKVVIETTGKVQFSCSNVTGRGEYLNTTALSGVTLTLTGCQWEGHSCSSGTTAGEVITTPLVGALGWVEKTGNSVGLALAPPHEASNFLEAVCGGETIKVTGSVIGVITPVNNMSTSFTLKFKETKGAQAIEKFQGEEAQGLRLSVNGSLSVAVGLSVEAAQTNEEEIEINTVV